MKEFLKKHLPLIIVLVFAIAVSTIFNPLTGDALVFSDLKGSIFSILKTRWDGTTSRVILEFILINILRNIPFLWRIINALMIVLLYKSMDKIFNRKNDLFIKYVIAIFMLLYTYLDMSSAGWSATTVNYLWTLSLGVFSLIPVVNILRGETYNKKLLILTIPSMIISANQEQCAALLFGFLCLFNLYYFLKNKKLNLVLVTYLLITIISLVVILICPGNFNRVDNEIFTWFKDYKELGLLDKLLLSLNNTFDMLLGRCNYVFMGFYMILSYILYKLKKDKKIVFTSIMLTIGTIVIPFMNIFRINNLYKLYHVAGEPILNNLHLEALSYKASILLSVGYLVCTVILLYIVTKSKDKYIKLFVPVMFLAGIISRFILGFSPTLYASSYRTGIFMNFIIIMLVPAVISMVKLTNKDKRNILIGLVSLFIFKWILLVWSFRAKILGILGGK